MHSGRLHDLADDSFFVQEGRGQFLLLAIKNPNHTYDQSIPLLGIYPRKMITYIHAKTCTPVFLAVVLMTAKSGNGSKVH